MENYISKDYFPRLEELLLSAKEDILNGTATNLNVLFQLLSALPVNIDLKELDIKKYAKSLIGNKAYTSFKDLIIFNALKNQRLSLCDIDNLQTSLNNLSAFYFLNNANADAMSSDKGIVCKGIDYIGNTFFDECTVTDLPISNNWAPIQNSVPPANAMLIIDQYIFGNPFQIKLNSLLDFIKLYKGNLQIPFHLSILFSPDNISSSQINQAFETLSGMDNTEIQLFLDFKIPCSDRLFFTNYTSGNIGHPFDGRHTRFTQNFLGRDNKADKIRNNYKNYKKDLLFWNSFIHEIPPNIGNIKTIWETSKFTNRLFDPILNN